MSPEEERQRFRKQFNDTQWSELIANPEFKSAWDGSNVTRAGEIAPRVLPISKDQKRETRSKAIDKTVGRVHLIVRVKTELVDRPAKPMTEKNTNQQWRMTEKDILAQATIVLDQQSGKSKTWKYAQHADLIANIAVEHGMPSTMRSKFRDALLIQGVGGNSSAFGKWLKKKGFPMTTMLGKIIEDLENTDV